MNVDFIVLAGGLGTRLQSVVADKPKCLAPINGKPFLYYLCKQIEKHQPNKVIFAVGYLHELVIEFMKSVQNEFSFSYEFSIEEEPLGTGGAILNAMQYVSTEDFFVVNGDTFFQVDFEKMYAFQKSKMADCTLSLKYMEQADRYGLVQTNNDDMLIAFHEKQTGAKGYINGGIYCVFKNAFLGIPFPTKFSFEKDYLEAYITQQNMYGFQQKSYFIDIGIPSDYEKANIDFKEMF